MPILMTPCLALSSLGSFAAVVGGMLAWATSDAPTASGVALVTAVGGLVTAIGTLGAVWIVPMWKTYVEMRMKEREIEANQRELDRQAAERRHSFNDKLNQQSLHIQELELELLKNKAKTDKLEATTVENRGMIEQQAGNSGPRPVIVVNPPDHPIPVDQASRKGDSHA